MRSAKQPIKPASAASTSGYSGTPLAKKLGIKESSHVCALNAPPNYRQLLEPLPPAVSFASRIGKSVDIIHVFATDKAELASKLTELRERITPDAAVWVSWPKKSSRVATTITEDTIRAIALPLGFVDVKVCAVTDVWSGLKLVVRKELR